MSQFSPATHTRLVSCTAELARDRTSSTSPQGLSESRNNVLSDLGARSRHKGTMVASALSELTTVFGSFRKLPWFYKYFGFSVPWSVWIKKKTLCFWNPCIAKTVVFSWNFGFLIYSILMLPKEWLFVCDDGFTSLYFFVDWQIVPSDFARQKWIAAYKKK